jgi:integral membrane sensor domain MASE1
MWHWRSSVLISLGCAALLGLASVILPVWILSLQPYTAPLFPLLRTGVEGISYLTILFLFVSGLLLGFVGAGHPLLLGFATMILLPCLAIAEMLASPTSHTLWPLEFALYGLISLCAAFGAFLGRYLRKRAIKSDV